MVILRLFVVFMVISTVLYVVISYIARALRQEKLKERWRVDGMVGSRDAWLRQELAKFDRGLRRQLIFWVYGLPMAFLAFISIMLYVQHYQ
ncbi:MAG: hypothetical protein AAFP13_11870 [Pseudomonadota bacterium]